MKNWHHLFYAGPLAKYKTFPIADDVDKYVIANPTLEPIIKRAVHMAALNLSDDAIISLEMFRDMDSDDEFPVLHVYQDRFSRETLAAIDTINGAICEQLGNATGWFMVSADFRCRREN